MRATPSRPKRSRRSDQVFSTQAASASCNKAATECIGVLSRGAAACAGAGHTAKTINQLIVGLTIQAIAESIVLAEAGGVDPHLLQQALAGGFADSKILQIHGTRMIKRDYTPGGKTSTQLKDLRLAQNLAATAGLTLPHLNDTIARYEQLIALGHANLDHSALHILLSP